MRARAISIGQGIGIGNEKRKIENEYERAGHVSQTNRPIRQSLFPESAVPCATGPYPIVNGAVALAVPHSTRSVAPAGVSSIEIVTFSTGAFVLPIVIGVRPISRSF